VMLSVNLVIAALLAGCASDAPAQVVPPGLPPASATMPAATATIAVTDTSTPAATIVPTIAVTDTSTPAATIVPTVAVTDTSTPDATATPLPASDPPGITLEFDASKPGEAIGNLASDLIMWDFHDDWLDMAEIHADDYFGKNMPFAKYVQFISATGGAPARDLFKNPDDRTVLDDYDFSSLVRACGNVLAKGLKPYVSTGNVPMKLSANPVVGGFGVNIRPPDDYGQYYKYMTALFQALKDTFGAEELLTWKWGVLTEYENGDWFSAAGGPKATEEAYCKLYDYTVDALQKVVGENVFVGAHGMTVIEGLWDERRFIDHCANGRNYITGETGTRLCFLNASYYDNSPGDQAGEAGQGLANTVKLLREKAEAAGLTGLEYGIDEGRILSGSDGKPLLTRTVGQTMQASWDARLFHIMLDNNINYFGSWGYTTEGIWNGVPSVAMHTANLIYKMAGEKRIPLMARKGRPSFVGNDVDGFAGAAGDGKRISVMAYACTADSSFDGSENVRVRLDGLPDLGNKAKVTKWTVDDDANFFDEWIADRKAHGIADDGFDWSRDSFVLTSPAVLKSNSDRMFFSSLKEKYLMCAELKSSEEELAIVDGAVIVDFVIPHHAVVFLDITPE
jgi:hypothetical protein